VLVNLDEDDGPHNYDSNSKIFDSAKHN